MSNTLHKNDPDDVFGVDAVSRTVDYDKHLKHYVVTCLFGGERELIVFETHADATKFVKNCLANGSDEY